MVGDNPMTWKPAARSRLERVPEGPMREMTRQRVERLAQQRGRSVVTLDLLEAKYREWRGSMAQAGGRMSWTEGARKRMERIPAGVVGEVIEAVEAYAKRHGFVEITSETLDEVKTFWAETGRFHSP